MLVIDYYVFCLQMDNWRPAVVGGISGAVMGFVQQLQAEAAKYNPF